MRFDVGIIRAVVSIKEEPGVGQSQLLGGGLGIGSGDAEIAIGVAGVGGRHPHAGDAFDVGDRRVADPVGTNTQLRGPGQVLDAPGETFEPLVVEMASVLSMQDKVAAVVS
jgi:hypothetical protein